VEESVATLNNDSELKTSWSTTMPSGLMKSTLPLESVASGSVEVNAPIMVIARKIKMSAVARSSTTVLTLARNRPSQEKIVFNAFM
jgi:hypothetical protein